MSAYFQRYGSVSPAANVLAGVEGWSCKELLRLHVDAVSVRLEYIRSLVALLVLSVLLLPIRCCF